jgi:hypothetical protein
MSILVNQMADDPTYLETLIDRAPHKAIDHLSKQLEKAREANNNLEKKLEFTKQRLLNFRRREMMFGEFYRYHNTKGEFCRFCRKHGKLDERHNLSWEEWNERAIKDLALEEK